jgi:hypothetical protein
MTAAGKKDRKVQKRKNAFERERKKKGRQEKKKDKRVIRGTGSKL